MALTEKEMTELGEELLLISKQIDNLRNRQRRLYMIRDGSLETEAEVTAQRAKVDLLAAVYDDIKAHAAIADVPVVARK